MLPAGPPPAAAGSRAPADSSATLAGVGAEASASHLPPFREDFSIAVIAADEAAASIWALAALGVAITGLRWWPPGSGRAPGLAVAAAAADRFPAVFLPGAVRDIQDPALPALEASAVVITGGHLGQPWLPDVFVAAGRAGLPVLAIAPAPLQGDCCPRSPLRVQAPWLSHPPRVSAPLHAADGDIIAGLPAYALSSAIDVGARDLHGAIPPAAWAAAAHPYLSALSAGAAREGPPQPPPPRRGRGDVSPPPTAPGAYSLRASFARPWAHGDWAPTIEACGEAEAACRVFPGLPYFTADDPVQAHRADLVGHVIYAHPPPNDKVIASVLDTIAAAMAESPRDTRAIVVVPWGGDAGWVRTLRHARHVAGSPYEGRYIFRRGKANLPASLRPVAIMLWGAAPSESAPAPPTEADAAADVQRAWRVAAASLAAAAATGFAEPSPDALGGDMVPEADFARELPDPADLGDSYATSAEFAAARETAAHLISQHAAGFLSAGALAGVGRWARGERPFPDVPPEEFYPDGVRGRYHAPTWTLWAATIDHPLVERAAAIAAQGCSFAMMAEPPWQCPPNAASTYSWWRRVQPEFDFWKRAGIVETFADVGGSVLDFAATVHGLLAVVRTPDDGKARICVNQAPQTNPVMATEPTSLPSPKTHAARLRRGDVQVREDLRKAFLHGRLTPGSRRYTAFIHPQWGLARLTSPNFGARGSPAITWVIGNAAAVVVAHVLGRIAVACGDAGLAAELDRTADTIDPYVDDFLAAGVPVAAAAAQALLHALGYDLGLIFDPAKTVVGRRIVALGAVVDSDTETLAISPARAQVYADFSRAFRARYPIDGPPPPPRLVWRLYGRLRFAASLSRWGLAHMATVAELHRNRAVWPAVAEAIHVELQHIWEPALAAAAAEGSPMLTLAFWEALPTAALAATAHLRALSDASGDFGGGGGSRFGTVQRRWLRDEGHWHIGIKELAALVGTLIGVLPRLPYASHVIAECDNVAAVSYINRGGGPPAVVRILAPLIALAAKYAARIRAVHRPGSYMVAMGPDRASRETVHFASRMPTPADAPVEWRQAWRHLDILQFTQEDAAQHPGPAARCPVCQGMHAHGGVCPACVHAHVFGDAADAATCAAMGPLAAEVADLLAGRRAATTTSTYACGVRRFAGMVQRRAARHMHVVSASQIIPLDPQRPIALSHILAFLCEAVGHYTTATIEQTLSALRDFQLKRSFGTQEGLTNSYMVRAVLEGVRRKHAGTPLACAQAALPVPASLVAALVDTLMACAESFLAAGQSVEAYGCSRDALFYALAFTACLRQGEAVHTQARHLFRRNGRPMIFIPRSKTDPYGHGVELPLPTISPAGIRLEAAFDLHERVRSRRGVTNDVLFGHVGDPRRQLDTATTIVDRLNARHLPALAPLGIVWPAHARLTGHSFRRGGITELRDGMRRRGTHPDQIRSVLLAAGRWRDPRSLLVYLTEDITALAIAVCGE